MRILFIGNSHTYFNDTPQMFKDLCNANDEEVTEAVMLAHGGIGLDYHYKEPEAKYNILCGKYDVVVLQHKIDPFPAETLFEAGIPLAEYCKEAGSRVIVYMPWMTLPNRDKQQEALSANADFAFKIRAMFAPVGIAWWDFFDAHPEVQLFRRDERHATREGSYLVSCSLFCSIFGKRPKTDGDPVHEQMADCAFATFMKFMHV